MGTIVAFGLVVSSFQLHVALSFVVQTGAGERTQFLLQMKKGIV
jgi:hypothetical protein